MDDGRAPGEAKSVPKDVKPQPSQVEGLDLQKK